MSVNRVVAALVVMATASACAAVGRPAAETEASVADSVTTDTRSTVTTTTAIPPSAPRETGADDGQTGSVPTSTTEPPSTSVTDPPAPTGDATTTTVAEPIDLDSVYDALDSLERLFGDFAGEVGSIDLDEGENP